MFYYYDKAKIEKGKIFCVYQSNHKLSPEEIDKINETQGNILENTVVYSGTLPFIGYPIIENDTIRPANERELIELGLLSLGEGEILQGDKIVKISRPSFKHKWVHPNWIVDESKLSEGEIVQDNRIVKVEKPADDEKHVYVWNNVTKKYENSLTEEEITERYHNLIASLKEKAIEIGFMTNGHRQKCRTNDIVWLNCRLKETYDHAILNNIIDPKYQIIGDKNKLKQVGWVFGFNEVVMLNVFDFKKLFDMGAEFCQAAFTAEEILKSKPEQNMKLTVDDFMKEMQKYTSVVPANLYM